MIGIDIVSIDRIKRCMKKFGDKFYDRFLCEDEKEFIKSPQNAAGFGLQKRLLVKLLGLELERFVHFMI